MHVGTGGHNAGPPSPLKNDPAARTLNAGDLEAVFLPGYGMLGASLRHRGVELLGRVQDLATAAAEGSTAGIPLLHPWANRLAGSHYRVAGREVALDPASPFLHFDAHGLPIHGVPWSRLAWELIESSPDGLTSRLAWTQGELLAVFPFPHRLEMAVTLSPEGLTLETRLFAGLDGPVPVSFGFHPYFVLPGLPRSQWRLKLPPMRMLVIDPCGIPTGEEEPFFGHDAELGTLNFDNGFAVLEDRPAFSLAGAGRRITVELLAGYRYAQVYAPQDQDYVALEPMTAPTSALTSGRGLTLVPPGGQFSTSFKIRVEALP
ncbi:MAG: aldose epimerase family protein [Desulfobaccales bacterium]